jgi:VWFA-related protein
MKKIRLFALVILLVPVGVLISQNKPQQSVVVTAVEVPVRVFDGTGFVAGLAKEDFEVYENGIKQEITGFEAVSRTIAPAAIALPDRPARTPRPRNFVLIFNVFDYTDQIGEAIDYFFKTVFAPGDRLVVLAKDKFFDLESSRNADALAAGIKEALIKYKKISGFEIWQSFHYLEGRAENLAAALTGSKATDYPTQDLFQAISQFCENYKTAWQEYRRRLLDMNLDLYRVVIRKLDRWDGEKWAICFQQRDLFPRLKSQGRLDTEIRNLLSGQIEPGMQARARFVQTRLDELNLSFDITDSLPAEQIRTLFAEANITFHVLIMKSLSRPAANYSRDLELRDVHADYEDVLRRISRSSGGLAAFSNSVLETLQKASVKEDKYYLLVYQPQDRAGEKERTIEVRVRREGVDVVSLKKFVGVKPPAIAISGLESRPKTIAFNIGNYVHIFKDGKDLGRATVRITIFDDKSVKVFDEAKTLDLTQKTIYVSLNLKQLQAGDHFVIIEAVDIISGEKDVLSGAVVF